jgi:hypothetical protein
MAHAVLGSFGGELIAMKHDETISLLSRYEARWCAPAKGWCREALAHAQRMLSLLLGPGGPF